MNLEYSELNVQAFFRLYAQLSSAKFIDLPQYKAIISKVGTWPNSVFSFNVSENTASSEIEKLIAKMKLGELPTQLRTPPTTALATVELLRNKSVRHVTWAAMGMEMSNLVIKNTVEDIRRVEDAETLESWIKIVEVELMKGGKIDRQAFVNLLEHASCQFYLAYVDGVPASTSLTFINQNTVGVYLVATAAKFQRRGLGTAVTAHSLNVIQDKNITHAYLQATDIGKSVYASIGFEDLGKIGGFAML